MSAGHFGQISLFLPLYAILELPYLFPSSSAIKLQHILIVSLIQLKSALALAVMPCNPPSGPTAYHSSCSPLLISVFKLL